MYKKICSFENLLKSYRLARKNNRYKQSVCRFDFFLESNLFRLQQELVTGSYTTKPYKHFVVTDPKKRQVAAPDFRDRVVQHALVSAIEPIFDKGFINDTFACRKNKGTHFAQKRVKKFLQAARSVHGKDKELYVLKCDIKKFFPSISWNILLRIIKRKITCDRTISLIEKIVTFHEVYNDQSLKTRNSQLSLFERDNLLNPEEVVSISERKGLPIGNLTSQLFANVYLNELDQFVKNILRERWYGRYMDDFLVISADKKHLFEIKEKIRDFLWEKLKLTLHPKKSFVQNTKDGVCFVGYRIFYDHILIKGSTLLRMQKKLKKRRKQLEKGLISPEKYTACANSLAGHLKHASAYRLKQFCFSA